MESQAQFLVLLDLGDPRDPLDLTELMERTGQQQLLEPPDPRDPLDLTELTELTELMVLREIRAIRVILDEGLVMHQLSTMVRKKEQYSPALAVVIHIVRFYSIAAMSRGYGFTVLMVMVQLAATKLIGGNQGHVYF
jgi:hypothetical protein